MARNGNKLRENKNFDQGVFLPLHYCTLLSKFRPSCNSLFRDKCDMGCVHWDFVTLEDRTTVHKRLIPRINLRHLAHLVISSKLFYLQHLPDSAELII